MKTPETLEELYEAGFPAKGDVALEVFQELNRAREWLSNQSDEAWKRGDYKGHRVFSIASNEVAKARVKWRENNVDDSPNLKNYIKTGRYAKSAI